MSDIKINVEEGVKTLIIREGDALPVKEPRSISISGTIDAVTRFLDKRKDTLEQKECCILIDRDKMSILLIIDETNHYAGSVIARLENHPDFDKYGINAERGWNTAQLAEFIKMNRSAFSDKKTAMDLTSKLLNLKIKVERELEKSDNNRGDVRMMAAQKVIDNSIPEGFTINVHIFKGQPKKEIYVEIYVNPDTYNVRLVSADANDIIEETKNTAIDAELSAISELCEDIVQVEQ